MLVKIMFFITTSLFLISCSNEYPIHKIPPKQTSVVKEDLKKVDKETQVFDEYSDRYDTINNDGEFNHICFTYDGVYIGNLSKYSLECHFNEFKTKHKHRYNDKICYRNMVFSDKEFEKLKRECRRFQEEKHLGSGTYENLTQ